MVELYNKLMELCEEKGVTGYKMAIECGLSGGFMTDLKSGRHKSVSAKNAKKLADYFGVTVNEIIGYEPSEKQKKTAPIRAVTRDISEKEYDLIKAYRSAPAPIKDAIDALCAPYKKSAKSRIG